MVSVGPVIFALIERSEIMYKLEGYLRILYIILQCCFVENAVLYEGSDCKASGISGICARVKNCPPAIDSLIRTKTTGLKRCGFVGKDELVCCPAVKTKSDDNYFNSNEDNLDYDTVKENRFIKRKCEQACEEISAEAKSKVNFHIIGGVDAEEGEFPHMAALGYDVDSEMSWECGASIISNRYLLTAAHCITNLKQLEPKVVRVGVTMLNDSKSQDYQIKNTTVHPNYSPASKHHDIALVEVHKEIKFSNKVFPACLYFENDDPLGLIVTGWGKTSIASQDDRSNILQKATLTPTPLNECNTSYVTRMSGSKYIVQTQICAGSSNRDSCWGDSGGPLQIENKEGSYSIVGIISFGAGCGGKVPGVYTRVSRYLEWIEKKVWP